MNNKGQQVMIGIMIMVMAVILFIATLPAIRSVIGTARGCDNLNCGGYIDADASSGAAVCSATNRSYQSSLEEDTLSCTILDLGIPYLILGVLVGLVAKLLHGKMVEPEPPQYMGGY